MLAVLGLCRSLVTQVSHVRRGAAAVASCGVSQAGMEPSHHQLQEGAGERVGEGRCSTPCPAPRTPRRLSSSSGVSVSSSDSDDHPTPTPNPAAPSPSPQPDTTASGTTPEPHTTARATTPEFSTKPKPHLSNTSLAPRSGATPTYRSVRRKAAPRRGRGTRAWGERPRRALYVATPVPPLPREHQITRAQTEPPASPDLLQVSWVWESPRSVSLRRRPSCRVSCRWKARPRMTPRRTPLRCLALAPGAGGDELGEDNSKDADTDDTVVIWQAPGQEVGVAGRRAATLTTVGPQESGDTQDPPVVHLRDKRGSTTSRSLKRKWRHSELLFPRLLTEALKQVKTGEGDGKAKNILEKAKNLPGYMKRVSHLLFKGGKDDERKGLDARKQSRASTFYLEMKDYPEEESWDDRVVVRGGGLSRGVKRPTSSPRCTLGRPRGLNWSQKYQRAMGQRDPGGPAICVTSPDYPGSLGGREGEDDSRSTGGKGLLGRILGQLRRPRTASTSRSCDSSRSSMSGGSEDGQSPSHSSDYEEQEEAERTGSASLVGRMRGLRRDMQKKISRLKSPRGSTSSSPAPLGTVDRPGASLAATGVLPQPAATSYESIPSSTPMAAAPSGSNRSSLSGEDAEPYTGPFIGRARALVDCQPSPYDRDALKFKKGDIIDIIAKTPSGLWKGCVEGRVGHFKFILVEEEVERPARRSRAWRSSTPRRGRSRTLEELLTRLHLSHLIQVFVLNGYEDLDQFRDVEKADLDCLGITDPETRAKLLTAVALLHDADSEPEPDHPETLETTEAALRRGDHGRDSGCYTDHRCSTHPPITLDENNLDTRQSTPSTDTSSGYHSRGPYNIPLGEGGQTSRDDAHALDSPPSESTTTTSGTTTLPSSASDSYSYRAHPATVLPASPHTQVRHATQGDHRHRHDPDVDYEAKFVTARSVFEKEVVRREVPVSIRGQKRGTDSQQSSVGEAEEAGNCETSSGAAEPTS